MKLIVLAAVLVVGACSKQETAKDAYSLQSHACLDSYSARADQIACLDRVRNAWTEAGATPVAASDAGEVIQ